MLFEGQITCTTTTTIPVTTHYSVQNSGERAWTSSSASSGRLTWRVQEKSCLYNYRYLIVMSVSTPNVDSRF